MKAAMHSRPIQPFREKLISRIRFDPRAALRAGDGLAGRTTSQLWLPTWLARLIMAFVLTPKKQADTDAKDIRSSSAIVVFVSARDGKAARVEVGRAPSAPYSLRRPAPPQHVPGAVFSPSPGRTGNWLTALRGLPDPRRDVPKSAPWWLAPSEWMPPARQRYTGADMSRKRRNPSVAKARRDRRRAEKHARRVESSGRPDPVIAAGRGYSFAAERTLREVLALTEGQDFDSVEDLNARLAELTRGGRLSEMAQALKRDDPKWRAQELAYDAMEADDPLEALRLASEAQKLDPGCTDAQRLMVWLLPMELHNRIRLMREVVGKAERNLGEEFLKQHEGHFWGMLSTRPYMRAMQDLADLLIQADRLDEAIAVCERMLELNPNDNQGVRYTLVGLYLASRREERADELWKRYPDEEHYSAVFAWARVITHWLAGREADARSALLQARSVNSFVERYLAGKQQIPEQLPPAYYPGDDSEAQIAAAELSLACRRLPEFTAWLREQP
jgi:tetratricopeptide (TPR) repeat protein